MSKQPKSHLKRLATFDYINSAILLERAGTHPAAQQQCQYLCH